MKSKLFLSGVLTAMMLGSFDANAMYIGASAGVSKNKLRENIENKTFSSNGAYTVSLGYVIPVPFVKPRVELEYVDLLSSEDHDDVKTRGVAANAFVNIPVLPVVTPYAGVGMGFFRQEMEYDKSDWKVLPQYMVGLDLSVPMFPLAFAAEYRLIDTSFDYDNRKFYRPNASVDSKIQSILVKGRINF